MPATAAAEAEAEAEAAAEDRRRNRPPDETYRDVRSLTHDLQNPFGGHFSADLSHFSIFLKRLFLYSVGLTPNRFWI